MQNCGDCGAAPGEFHGPGCDVERCPRCGGQRISCDCIYEVNGMAPDSLEEDHPDVYEGGPTPEMYARWDREWGPRRLRRTGVWPGEQECVEFGWYARMAPGRGWVPCSADAPGAHPDLNRLAATARWDADAGRYVRPEDN